MIQDACMSIDLIVRPGPALTRDQFLESHPGYGIALDGYVFGAPFLIRTAVGPYRNFNHHEAVDRSCTSATCEQARRAVLLGLYDLFRRHGQRTATLYANDCDQDVCLASWILMHPDRAAEPLVRTISQVNDLLDMAAGVFPMPHEGELLGQVRWVFAPYRRARVDLARMSGETMREVIADVHARIDQFVIGRAGTTPLAGQFRNIGGGKGWVFAEVTHQDAREKLIASGVRAAVELSGFCLDRFTYTVWRRSEYVVDFPVPDILAALNVAEGFASVDPAGWGGADNVGGSPRGRGSSLGPADVERVVNMVVEGAGS